MIFKIKEKVKGKEMIFVQLYAITYLSNNYHHHHHHHQANENEMKSKRKEKEILFKTKNHDDF